MTGRSYRVAKLLVVVLAGLLPGGLLASSIVGTRHNLSISGPGPVKSTTEQEICIFCHTPHQARRDIPYLWNRADSTASYIPYQSSTLRAAVGQPTGASKQCLSCHDGTVALGALLTRPQEVPFEGGIRFLGDGRSKLGTDLSDDHPVSFVYDSALAAGNPELTDPLTLPAEVRLDKNHEMQCTACHDPHDNNFGKFLVRSNQYAGLCTTCHNKNGWIESSHAQSNRTWTGTGTNPWPNSTYPTVAENGCLSCHVSHSAGGHARLLNYANEEDNCLTCHTGNVATKNIGGELTKRSGHFVQNTTGVHDEVENFTQPGVPKHVECADCHNPHESNALPGAGAPFVSGATRGVRGIDLTGQAVPAAQYEYEICNKCHGDNNVVSSFPVTRQIAQLNTRLEFDPANPSFHPVAGVGVNPNVPSLVSPYTTTSRIRCSDCHNNDDTLGPKGPHGSNNSFLLTKNYTTADNTLETSAAYELCYTCHSRTSILANESFKGVSGHALHIVTNNTPCSACHDPHGVSVSQGNPLNNAALINFDLNIVQPDPLGQLNYQKTGTFSGTCTLSCHNHVHNAAAY